MKQAILLTLISVVLLASCGKEEKEGQSIDFGQITGTYSGELKVSDNVVSDNATVVVSKEDNETVKVHCYSLVVDTTFMLNVYGNDQQVMTCLTGTAFSSEYGHEMNGHMMHSSTSTDWHHHIEDNHEMTDEHNGNFDLNSNSFTCHFTVSENSMETEYEFNGNK